MIVSQIHSSLRIGQKKQPEELNIEALKYTSTSLEQKVFHQGDIRIDGAIASSSSAQQKISTSGANKPSAKGLDDTDIRMAEEVMLKLKKENIYENFEKKLFF